MVDKLSQTSSRYFNSGETDTCTVSVSASVVLGVVTVVVVCL